MKVDEVRWLLLGTLLAVFVVLALQTYITIEERKNVERASDRTTHAIECILAEQHNHRQAAYEAVTDMMEAHDLDPPPPAPPPPLKDLPNSVEACEDFKRQYQSRLKEEAQR